MDIFYLDQEFSLPGRSGGSPFHVTTGMPDWIFYVSFVLVISLCIAVSMAMRKERRLGLTKAEREQKAIESLLKIDKRKIIINRKKAKE